MKSLIRSILKTKAGQIILNGILKEFAIAYAKELLPVFRVHLENQARKKYANSHERLSIIVKYLRDLEQDIPVFIDGDGLGLAKPIDHVKQPEM